MHKRTMDESDVSAEVEQGDHANIRATEKRKWTGEETALVRGLLQEAESNGLTWKERVIRINSETKARGGSYTYTLKMLKHVHYNYKSVEAEQRYHANRIPTERHEWTAEETALVRRLLQEAQSNNLTWPERLIQINSETKARGGSRTYTMNILQYFHHKDKDLIIIRSA
jgi:hypothetical protein